MGEVTLLHYCTWCFAEIPAGTTICPDCGTNLDDYARHTPYQDRLIHALHHPLSETRMAAILALGKQADPKTINALTDCALEHDGDVIEGLEILHSLSLMPTGSPLKAALQRLASDHPAHAVRMHTARQLESRFTETS
jgi:HEAT repeat protein